MFVEKKRKKKSTGKRFCLDGGKSGVGNRELPNHDENNCKVPDRINKIPLKGQRFARTEPVERCFVLNDSDDDDDLFFKSSRRNESMSVKGYHEQVEVDVQGARKMVMALV
ncbi:uncharacterized protein EV420DRAFT_1487116 [Desarmillaria tabescens]|uniref:Uncharacterized protein n=1 Tax=Armillaria tabescens TaxID=1929756 RepID=A0AA39ML44_ARMTA|nr:uncharacterized protein EV420DRAFT_1487116 [Desarmillaria tabescens]KAK0437420.1 hypothetical protein EV420DRAFT_1487116 [Desarmillaria tabescens]